MPGMYISAQPLLFELSGCPGIHAVFFNVEAVPSIQIKFPSLWMSFNPIQPLWFPKTAFTTALKVKLKLWFEKLFVTYCFYKNQ